MEQHAYEQALTTSVAVIVNAVGMDLIESSPVRAHRYNGGKDSWQGIGKARAS